MRNTIQDFSQKLTPKAVMVVYSNNNSYYLEAQPVKTDGTLGVARPVSREFVENIAKTFSVSERMLPSGPIPSNMLYADPHIGKEKYIWWTPPKTRRLYFSEKTNMKEANYQMPGCVYQVIEKSLYVWAFKGNKPKMGEKLLQGPFYNYYENGRICLGSAKVEWPDAITWKSIQDHWEKLFWGSENSHTICNPMKKDEILTTALKEAIDKPFDTRKLNETEITIASLINSGR